MPTYCYKDSKNKIHDRVFPMGAAPEYVLINGGTAVRCRPAEYASQGGQHASTWPMTSQALAVHPSQRHEYMDFASKSGVPTHFDPRGRPVFRSRGHRRRYAELVGATDFDGGYGDPDSR